MDLSELNYQMTTMFIQQMVKNFQLVEASESEIRSYLHKVFNFCQNASTENNFAPTTVAAQDGWLLLKDLEGREHQVPYRGVWTIENLKDYIQLKHNIAPDHQHLTMVAESFTSHD